MIPNLKNKWPKSRTKPEPETKMIKRTSSSQDVKQPRVSRGDSAVVTSN